MGFLAGPDVLGIKAEEARDSWPKDEFELHHSLCLALYSLISQSLSTAIHGSLQSFRELPYQGISLLDHLCLS